MLARKSGVEDELFASKLAEEVKQRREEKEQVLVACTKVVPTIATKAEVSKCEEVKREAISSCR